MPYRPPTHPPKGAWARHLHRKRQELGWSQQRAFEEFREGLHFGDKSRAAYVAIDQGYRQPTDEEAAYLISRVGAPAEDEEAPAASEPGLAEALKAVAAAMAGFEAELRAARQERAEYQARLAGLEATVALLAQRSDATRRGPAAPRQTVG